MCRCIVNFISKYILFTFPIGWDEIGVIATVAAIIVALVANKSSRKQLVKALEMQEQSKNVQPLEQRSAVIDSLLKGDVPSETKIKLLFSANIEIYLQYRLLQEQTRLYEEACSDEKIFFIAVDETKGFDPDNDIKARIADFRNFIDRPDCPPKINDEFRKYCNQNTQEWSATGLANDRKDYNYAEIRDRMIIAKQGIEKTRKDIIKLMEDFIAASIKPVNEGKKT